MADEREVLWGDIPMPGDDYFYLSSMYSDKLLTDFLPKVKNRAYQRYLQIQRNALNRNEIYGCISQNENYRYCFFESVELNNVFGFPVGSKYIDITNQEFDLEILDKYKFIQKFGSLSRPISSIEIMQNYDIFAFTVRCMIGDYFFNHFYFMEDKSHRMYIGIKNDASDGITKTVWDTLVSEGTDEDPITFCFWKDQHSAVYYKKDIISNMYTTSSNRLYIKVTNNDLFTNINPLIDNNWTMMISKDPAKYGPLLYIGKDVAFDQNDLKFTIDAPMVVTSIPSKYMSGECIFVQRPNRKVMYIYHSNGSEQWVSFTDSDKAISFANIKIYKTGDFSVHARRVPLGSFEYNLNQEALKSIDLSNYNENNIIETLFPSIYRLESMPKGSYLFEVLDFPTNYTNTEFDNNIKSLFTTNGTIYSTDTYLGWLLWASNHSPIIWKKDYRPFPKDNNGHIYTRDAVYFNGIWLILLYSMDLKRIKYLYSTDGINWELKDFTENETGFYTTFHPGSLLVINDALYVYGVYDTDESEEIQYLYSTDGLNWEWKTLNIVECEIDKSLPNTGNISSPIGDFVKATALYGVSKVNDVYIAAFNFIASNVDGNGQERELTDRLAYSTDGINWECNCIRSNYRHCYCYFKGLYIDYDHTYNYSTDLKYWTRIDLSDLKNPSISLANYIHCITPDYILLVYQNDFLYSNDGLSWSTGSINGCITNIQGVYYISNKNLLVCTGYENTIHYIYYTVLPNLSESNVIEFNFTNRFRFNNADSPFRYKLTYYYNDELDVLLMHSQKYIERYNNPFDFDYTDITQYTKSFCPIATYMDYQEFLKKKEEGMNLRQYKFSKLLELISSDPYIYAEYLKYMDNLIYNIKFETGSPRHFKLNTGITTDTELSHNSTLYESDQFLCINKNDDYLQFDEPNTYIKVHVDNPDAVCKVYVGGKLFTPTRIKSKLNDIYIFLSQSKLKTAIEEALSENSRPGDLYKSNPDEYKHTLISVEVYNNINRSTNTRVNSIVSFESTISEQYLFDGDPDFAFSLADLVIYNGKTGELIDLDNFAITAELAETIFEFDDGVVEKLKSSREETIYLGTSLGEFYLTMNGVSIILQEEREDFEFTGNLSNYLNKVWHADELRFKLLNEDLIGTEIVFAYSPIGYSWNTPLSKFTADDNYEYLTYSLGNFIGLNDYELFELYINGEYIGRIQECLELPNIMSTNSYIKIKIPISLSYNYDDNAEVQLVYNPVRYHTETNLELYTLPRPSSMEYENVVFSKYDGVNQFNSNNSKVFIYDKQTAMITPSSWIKNKEMIDLQYNYNSLYHPVHLDKEGTSFPIVKDLKRDKDFMTFDGIPIIPVIDQLLTNYSSIEELPEFDPPPPVNFSALTLGSEFTYGKYQILDEEPWPIEWEIVHQEDDYQIAQSKYIIDVMSYDNGLILTDEYKGITGTITDDMIVGFSERRKIVNEYLASNNMVLLNSDIDADIGYGLAQWNGSVIEQYLNSDQINWYTPAHLYDIAVVRQNVPDILTYEETSDYIINLNTGKIETHNYYSADIKPFLYYFTESEKKYLQPITLQYEDILKYACGEKPSVYDWTGKVWLPKIEQITGDTKQKYSGESYTSTTFNKYLTQSINGSFSDDDIIDTELDPHLASEYWKLFYEGNYNNGYTHADPNDYENGQWFSSNALPYISADYDNYYRGPWEEFPFSIYNCLGYDLYSTGEFIASQYASDTAGIRPCIKLPRK